MGKLKAMSHKKNIHQGSTPLHLACGSGIADVVQVLVMFRADLHKVDGQGRGCLQLASQCQGDNQVLFHWLRKTVPGIGMTDGRGRAREDRTRGQFTEVFRKGTAPMRRSRSKP